MRTVMDMADASQCVTRIRRPCVRILAMHSCKLVHRCTSSHFSVPLLMRLDCLYLAPGISTTCSCAKPSAAWSSWCQSSCLHARDAMFTLQH
jgi:hypothetical protein